MEFLLAAAEAAHAAGESAGVAAARGRTETRAGLLPVRPEFVVFFAFVRVAEDFVGLVDLFEFFLGRLFVLGQIGMVLPREFAEGFFDFVGRRRFGDTERLVVIAEFHGRRSLAEV